MHYNVCRDRVAHIQFNLVLKGVVQAGLILQVGNAFHLGTNFLFCLVEHKTRFVRHPQGLNWTRYVQPSL